MNRPMLAIARLTLRFGGLTAVNSVSFTVAPGEILAVIGPNGAGKTSLFNAITGVYPPSEGQVLINGVEVIAPFQPRLLAQWAALGLATGFAVLLAIQAQEMWKAAIVDLYLPNRAFPWGQACRQALGALVPATWSLLPVVIGLALGTAAGWRLWLGTRRGAERVARAGVGRTFQNIRLFGDLNCRDNVLIGMHSRLRAAWYDAAFRLLRHRTEEQQARASAMELLRFVGLEDVAERPAGVLPYGHQRRLEIARALALKPGLLLLDEPAAGMNPTESQELMALIRRIRETGTTCLLIEHDMAVVMGVSDRIVVLHYGTKIAEGTPAEIRSNPEVIEAYLGKEDSGRFTIPRTDRMARKTTRRESKL